MSRTNILLALVLLTGAGLVTALWDFWKPVFWAVVFAVLFMPLCDRIAGLLAGRRSLAAAATMVVAAIFVFIPAIYFAGAVITQAVDAYDLVQTGADNMGRTLDDIEGLVRSYLGAEAGGVAVDTFSRRIDEIVSGFGAWFGSLILGAGQSAALFVIQLGMMLYLLFFLLRDGARIFESLSNSIPLSGGQKERFFDRFAVVTVATIKGTLVVSVVQGALGGLIFAALGIQGALFWGALMSVLAILPAIGAAIVWFPAAVLLALGGDWARALVLLGFGTLVISVVDNLLRPILVGRDSRLPDWLVLFATVGGLSAFGMSGFVAGPVLAALFLVSWQMLGESIAR